MFTDSTCPDSACKYRNRLGYCTVTVCVAVQKPAAIRDQTKTPTNDAVPVVRCTACKHWDRNSGLTARKCDKWDAFTTQWDYCSYGRKTDGTDNP